MKNYRKEYEQLIRLMKELELEIPETMVGYQKLERNHSMDGALCAKTKELVALGISITNGCEGCMIIHLQHALEKGANRSEILEVLSVAVMMGGAPVLIYAGQLLQAVNQFETKTQPARLYEHV